MSQFFSSSNLTQGQLKAVESLVGDPAHLSIVESSPPSAMPLSRIRPERDLSDQEHRALDESIFRLFQQFAERKQMPPWDYLLCNIISGDERLRVMKVREAEELLKRESSLAMVLEKAWNDRTFKEVRRLGMLLCSPSDSSH